MFVCQCPPSSHFSPVVHLFPVPLSSTYWPAFLLTSALLGAFLLARYGLYCPTRASCLCCIPPDHWLFYFYISLNYSESPRFSFPVPLYTASRTLSTITANDCFFANIPSQFTPQSILEFMYVGLVPVRLNCVAGRHGELQIQKTN